MATRSTTFEDAEGMTARFQVRVSPVTEQRLVAVCKVHKRNRAELIRSALDILLPILEAGKMRLDANVKFRIVDGQIQVIPPVKRLVGKRRPLRSED